VSARQLAVLDADAVRRWVSACREGLAAARDEIDDLNVYPVPDGDTGTNLLLTMESAASAVEESAPGASLGEVTAAMAKGALMGARGNSGVILSQLLRGLSDVLAEAETGSGAELKGALRRAAELAYGAVATPVEGTLLTVARECADGVEAVTSSELVDVVRAAVAAAARSLAGTTELLPQLKAAGVVDAGGRGLCVLLEALQQVVTGESAASSAAPQLLVPRDRSGLARARESGSDAYAYEVQYLLTDADEVAVERLREVLGGLGDSLVVVGGSEPDGGLWNVHVHVNDVGAAVEAGVEAGRPSRITVTRFADQVGEGSRGLPVMNERPDGRSVVAVAPRHRPGGAVHRLGSRRRRGRAQRQPLHRRAARRAATQRRPRGGAAAQRLERAGRGLGRGRPGPRRGLLGGRRPHPVGAAGARGSGGRRRHPVVRRRRRGHGRGRRLHPLGRGHHRRARGGDHGRHLPPRRRARPARGRRRADRHRRRGGRGRAGRPDARRRR
jgi:hypothetical protein